jgi:hypothetical protein
VPLQARAQASDRTHLPILWAALKCKKGLIKSVNLIIATSSIGETADSDAELGR